MKQLIQHYQTGEMRIDEVPTPQVRSGRVLVKTVNSLISLGTEKATVEYFKKSLARKAIERRDLTKQVIDLVRANGVVEAFHQVRNHLDIVVPLGYSAAGEVIAVGDGMEGFRVGDRVACSGSETAPHAEILSVPKNMCVKIPEGLSYEEAIFLSVGAISLHAVRLANLTAGENVAIIGMGLLGQLASQLVTASGCRAMVIDNIVEKVNLGLELGAREGAIPGKTDVHAKAMEFSGGYGVDAVIITASGKGSQAIETAAEISRMRGRIIAPGIVNLDVPRTVFYEKELTLTVAKSSGPGTHDADYEMKGTVYPYHYIRWTETRNMEYFLNLVAECKVNVSSLITGRFKLEEAREAFDLISGDKAGEHIGVLFTYGEPQHMESKVVLEKSPAEKSEAKAVINVGMIGAGNYAKLTLLPTIKKFGNVNLRGISTATPINAKHAAGKYGFEYCTVDYHEILDDPEIDLVVIATRDNLHAGMAADAVRAGKRVFVEKPLAISPEQLHEIRDAVTECSGQVMVGYNRRFAPLVVKAREVLDMEDGPMVINCRVNAEMMSGESWIFDPDQASGRIIGEGCHFVDLVQYFTGSVPVEIYTSSLGTDDSSYINTDNIVANMKMKDGSIASIIYTSSGDRALPRERVEILKNGMACVIDNFKSLIYSRNLKSKKISKRSIDRGVQNQFQALFSSVEKGEKLPTDFNDHLYTTLSTFAILDSLKSGTPVRVSL